ncbi:MAG: hypothetical protein AUG85_09565 [Gemmatimonadetes bacterium 13_1_20CM_4_66_11]|nr:MAG: hypothetical protein AUG85_09565 [Gemmatimonadetes bacterium 13_1_20CM_4_66_11]
MEARAIQRGVRQSARKMRLVIDLIRGHAVPEADAILRFSKKRAARQIHKVLKSAVTPILKRTSHVEIRVAGVAAPAAPAPAAPKAEATAEKKPRAKKAPAAKGKKKVPAKKKKASK